MTARPFDTSRALADFLQAYGNLELRLVPAQAPNIYRATCICPKAGEPADCHAAGETPEEAIMRLFRFMQRDSRAPRQNYLRR